MSIDLRNSNIHILLNVGDKQKDYEWIWKQLDTNYVNLKLQMFRYAIEQYFNFCRIKNINSSLLLHVVNGTIYAQNEDSTFITKYFIQNKQK